MSTTIDKQDAVLAQMRFLSYYGITWKELGEHLQVHHGTASGILSKLHDEGKVVRLKEKRRNNSVYVHPGYEDGRETVARSKNVDEAALRAQIISDIEGLSSIAEAIAVIREGK